MAEQQTCGKGLAENSPLPGALGEVMKKVADNLELHLTALDRDDEKSRDERAAYEDLVAQHREIADRLKKVATQMAGYRDLPMGGHDKSVMGNEELRYAFKALIEREQELLDLLTDKIERERKMIGGLAGTGGREKR